MGCNCGGKRKQLAKAATSFVLQMPDGEKSEHQSRLDAEVHNIRAGGGGKVKPAR